MPRLPGLEAALATMAEQVSLNLPTKGLLASFGDEWAATLRSAVAVNGADLSSAIDAIEAAGGIEVVSTRG
jgi:hypothetical protein